MKYGSAHELDHIMVTKEDRWNVTCCKTVHWTAVREGPTKRMRNSRSREELRRQIDKVRHDGVIAWKQYTDPERVEICMRIAKAWFRGKPKNTAQGGQRPPDWVAMAGPATEATNKRKRYEETMEERLDRSEEASWKDICQVSEEVALSWVRGRKGMYGHGSEGERGTGPGLTRKCPKTRRKCMV